MVIFKVYDKDGNYEGFFTEYEQSMAENYVNAYGGHFEKVEIEETDD